MTDKLPAGKRMTLRLPDDATLQQWKRAVECGIGFAARYPDKDPGANCGTIYLCGSDGQYLAYWTVSRVVVVVHCGLCV